MYEAPQAKFFFRKRFSCKYCPGIRWKLGQILVGFSCHFWFGVSFFLQGTVGNQMLLALRAKYREDFFDMKFDFLGSIGVTRK